MGGVEICWRRAGRVERELRGREMAMIFQSPRTALNPIRKVGKQIEDVLREHANIAEPRSEAGGDRRARARAHPRPERRAEAYPFELSGGMCQRVMIAMALACSPSVLIADEPTTGLDVTTQAVIMDLIRDMSRSARMSTLLITHDLGLAGEYCDRIAVMHAGHVVEMRRDRDDCSIIRRHPYTRQLLAATPIPETPHREPQLDSRVSCRICAVRCRHAASARRCERRQPICDEGALPWTELSARTHVVRCRFPL